MANAVTNRTGQVGFTLVETLVALMVVAVAYAGVSTAVSQFLDQRHMVLERHAAHRVAWNRLMEQHLIARGRVLEQRRFGEEEGSADFMGRRWHWQLTRENTRGRDLVRYQVDVYDPARGVESPSGSLAAFFSR